MESWAIIRSQATGEYYQLRVLIPRLADLVEVRQDYLLLAECILTDVAQVDVPLQITNVGA